MLRVNIEHTIDFERRLVNFRLDPQRANPVMRVADGFWHTQSLDSGRTRVWLSASIRASRLVPNLVVDYAAYKAPPRATSWLLPYFSGQPLPPRDENPLDLC